MLVLTVQPGSLGSTFSNCPPTGWIFSFALPVQATFKLASLTGLHVLMEQGPFKNL